MHAEIGAFRKILAQQSVGVLIGAALPWAVRIAEIDLDASVDLQACVLSHLSSLIPSQRLTQLLRQGDDRSRNGVAHRLGTMPGECGAVLQASRVPWSVMRGRCSSRVKRVIRSTKVPIAELPRPKMRSPSQWPGTARSAASAGRWLIMISGEMKVLPRPRVRALGIRNTGPVRKQAVSSRRNAPRL